MGLRPKALACTIVTLALLTAACQSDTDSGAGTGSDSDDKVVKIGFIGPLTGGIAAFGQGMSTSAELAIEQANESGALDGWTIEYVAEDDASDAKQATSAAQKLASDPEIAAIIGTYNSSTAQAIQPILDRENIALVSPGNTNPTLTMGQEWRESPERPHDNYFRVVSTDKEQGEALGKYAYEDLERRNVVVIHDKKVYGQGIAEIFTESYEALGGEVATTLEINPGEGDYRSAVTNARGEDPDMIFYGGEFPEAGVIAKNMAELDLNPPDVVLMGGDGIVDKTFAEIGGDAAEGHYGTTVGISTDSLEGADQFVEDYKAKYNNEEYSVYGPGSYDTANLIIEALVDVLADAEEVDDSVREGVVQAIQDIEYEGLLGTTSFNEFGDTTNKILTINKVEDGEFAEQGILQVE